MATKNTPPANIDFNQSLSEAMAAASGTAAKQLAQQRTANAQMIKDSIAGTEVIASKLDPRYGTKGYSANYTKMGQDQVDAAAAKYAAMGQYADQLGGLAAQAQGDLAGTEIERMMKAQAESELALGGALTTEQERAAQQAARSGYAARGLATGSGSALAEVLNRDAYSQARMDARRAFAGSTNQMLVSNRQARLGTAGNMTGQAAGALQNAGAAQQSLAQSYVGLDPFTRALGSNIPISSQQTSANMITNAYGQVLNFAQDVNNTNFNAQWSNYLNNQNIAAANAAGQRQLSAASSAANSQLWGAGIGAAGAIGGAALIAL